MNIGFSEIPIILYERGLHYGLDSTLVFNRRRTCILYAMRLCNGGDRLHPCEKRREYHYEKPDGFLYRNHSIYGSPGQGFSSERTLCSDSWESRIMIIFGILLLTIGAASFSILYSVQRQRPLCRELWRSAPNFQLTVFIPELYLLWYIR